MQKITLDKVKTLFPNIKLDEEKYEYMLLESLGPSKLYSSINEDEIINKHLKHIISDYADEGWTIADCVGEMKGKYSVLGSFLFYKERG